MSNWSYVIASFSLTWLVLLGYPLYVRSRARRAEALLRDAERMAEVAR